MLRRLLGLDAKARQYAEGARFVRKIIDEVGIDLVPILLGEGVRFFGHLGTEPIELERTRVVEAPGVTHLRFRVIK